MGLQEGAIGDLGPKGPVRWAPAPKCLGQWYMSHWLVEHKLRHPAEAGKDSLRPAMGAEAWYTGLKARNCCAIAARSIARGRKPTAPKGISVAVPRMKKGRPGS